MLATGSVKKALPGLDFGGNVIGTEEAWALTELPGTLAVVGAGASGTEIASADELLVAATSPGSRNTQRAPGPQASGQLAPQRVAALHMACADEQREPFGRVAVDLGELDRGVPVTEIRREAAQEDL